MSPFQPLDQFNFHHNLESAPGVSLVVFTGPACGACKTLKQVLEDARFGEMNLFEVDAGEEMGLTREYNVFHLPAMFLFIDGRFHCELQAEAEAAHLRTAIDAALGRPPGEAP
jgi:thioredoxin 1